MPHYLEHNIDAQTERYGTGALMRLHYDEVRADRWEIPILRSLLVFQRRIIDGISVTDPKG